MLNKDMSTFVEPTTQVGGVGQIFNIILIEFFFDDGSRKDWLDNFNRLAYLRFLNLRLWLFLLVIVFQSILGLVQLLN